MRFRFSVIIPLLIALSSVTIASAPVEVKQYLALRKKFITSIPIETLRSNAPSYIGKIFEIRGTVSGFSRNSAGSSVIINTRDGGSYLINADALPQESPGGELACLVKIGEGSVQSLSDLRLVACTYDVDLRRIDEAAAAQASARKKTVQVQAAPKKNTTQKAIQNTTQTISSTQLLAQYKKAVKNFNCKLTDSQAETIAQSILGFSYKYKIDPRLVCAVILAESHFRLGATSSCGAQGLGQLMPSTAAGLGVNNAYDPVENVYGSVRYIKGMLDRMSGNKGWNDLTWNDLALALAAYNAGPGAVKKHGGVPPYRETQNYVKKVTKIYKQLCGVK